MNSQIELYTFTLAAIAGLMTQVLFGSLLLTFFVTTISAILIFQVFTHLSPTNFFENSS